MNPISSPTTGNRIFISTVTDEFEKGTGPFSGCRTRLRGYLSKADCEVKVQEEFCVVDVDTVEKLDIYIRRCTAVIHIVGSMPGARANATAVSGYLKAVPDFLSNYPELLAALGDFSDLTYTQWEAFMALHHGVSLRIYVTPDGKTSQSAHLERLRLARKYPADSPICATGDLLGLLIGDLRTIIPNLGSASINALNEAPPLPTAFYSRTPYLLQVASGWHGGDPPRIRIIKGESGTGKSSLAAEFYITAKRGLSEDEVIWIDCRAYFERPPQLRDKSLLQKLSILVLDNVSDNHPAISEEWLPQLGHVFVVITTTSQRVVDSLARQIRGKGQPEFIVEVEPFSVDERTAFFKSTVPDECVEPLLRCAASIGSSPVTLQFLSELAVNDPDHISVCAAQWSLKDLVDKWAMIADDDGVISSVIDCLAGVPFVGMDQEALQQVLNLPLKQVQDSVYRLQKLGVVTAISAPGVETGGSVLVLHESLRQIFGNDEGTQNIVWKERYGLLLHERLSSKRGPGVLTCVDAWLSGWKEVFDSTSGTPDDVRYERQQERLRLLLDAQCDTWSSALQALPHVLLSQNIDLAKEECNLVIGMAQMVARLPGHRSLAKIIWTGYRHQNLWARSACIAASIRQWESLGGAFMRTGVSELKMWLLLATQMYDSERYLPTNDKKWSADRDDDYLPVVCGILRIAGPTALNEATTIVRSAAFKQRFPKLTYCELALIVRFVDDGIVRSDATDSKTLDRLQILRGWAESVEGADYAIRLAAGTIGRYVLEYSGIRFQQLLDCGAESDTTPTLDIAKLVGSDRLWKYVCREEPNSRLHF